MKELVTAFILNWNRKDQIIAAIYSIKYQTYKNIDILIVDNASTDDSVAAVREKHPDVRVHVLDKNYGCVGGRNRGIEYVKGEYVFFMDDDALLHRRAVEIAYNSINQDDRIGVVGGSVNLFTNVSEADVDYELENEYKNRVTVNFHGGVCMHRVRMYAETGVYPDHYFYGGEEGYLAMKMLEKGYYVAENKSIILWHSKHTNNRNIAKELVNRQVNGLSNRISLWPWEFVLIYTAKSIIRHPYQAIVRGILIQWLQNYFSVIFPRLREAILNRKPVNRDTLRKYYGIKNSDASNVEEAQKKQFNYLQCILTEFIKS